MFCMYCGKQIPEEALFCPDCGKRTTAPAASEPAVKKPAFKLAPKKMKPAAGAAAVLVVLCVLVIVFLNQLKRDPAVLPDFLEYVPREEFTGPTMFLNYGDYNISFFSENIENAYTVLDYIDALCEMGYIIEEEPEEFPGDMNEVHEFDLFTWRLYHPDVDAEPEDSDKSRAQVRVICEPRSLDRTEEGYTSSCRIAVRSRAGIVMENYESRYKDLKDSAIDDDDDDRSSGSGSSNSKKCDRCRGSGDCTGCGGTGKESNWLAGTNEYVTQNCGYCMGSGDCSSCNGRGKR